MYLDSFVTGSINLAPAFYHRRENSNEHIYFAFSSLDITLFCFLLNDRSRNQQIFLCHLIKKSNPHRYFLVVVTTVTVKVALCKGQATFFNQHFTRRNILILLSVHSNLVEISKLESFVNDSFLKIKMFFGQEEKNKFQFGSYLILSSRYICFFFLK